jgi:hypothetical protein
MNQNNFQQFPFIIPLFSDTCKHTKKKTKVGDIIGCTFEVECSVGGFLILKQIIVHFFFKTIVKVLSCWYEPLVI